VKVSRGLDDLTSQILEEPLAAIFRVEFSPKGWMREPTPSKEQLNRTL
jgi:hypothetical protein